MPKARAGSLNRQRGKAVDNGGLRYGAMESALRPPLPTATPPIGDLPYRSFAEAQFLHRLTNPAGQNIITPISGSTRKVAGIKSEPRPASNRNQWPASCRMPGRLRRNPHFLQRNRRTPFAAPQPTDAPSPQCGHRRSSPGLPSIAAVTAARGVRPVSTSSSSRRCPYGL